MPRAFNAYGVGQALIPVLPLPLAFEAAPTVNQTNFEIGQIVFTPPRAPTAFYMYAGNGNWVLIASGSGDIVSVLGTAAQITSTVAAGVATLSLPSAITTPGSLTTTTSLASGTTLAAGTTFTAGTGITSTTGNITATNGNLVLGIAGNKLSIATGTNASTGTTAAMSGSPGAVTVASTAVTTSSIILFSRNVTGGTPGQVSITAQSAGSFTLTSTGNETSTFNYLIIN